jgi:hypothetical protein
VSWLAEFNEPIPLPKGRQLVTVEAAEWQAAMEALILVATSRFLTILTGCNLPKIDPATARALGGGQVLIF